MRLKSVLPAPARPFALAPETFPVIAAAAKEMSWFNSHLGRAPRVTVPVRGEHWVGPNIVRFVPGEVGKIPESSRHILRLDQLRPRTNRLRLFEEHYLSFPDGDKRAPAKLW